MSIMPTNRQADVLSALSLAETRRIQPGSKIGTFVMRGPATGRGRATTYVNAGDVDELITKGLIGRRDQRPVWYITERGKLALEDWQDNPRSRRG